MANPAWKDVPVAAPIDSALVDDVRRGLALPQKELSPKYFYDQRGSELFEEITKLPEYYLSRTERRLLERWMPELLRRLRSATLLELGAGAAAKTRLILDAMRAAGSAELYVPVDVSEQFLHDASAGLRADYEGLTVWPLVADISGPLAFPLRMPRPVLFAFLGSTMGNFEESAAIALLSRVRGTMAPDDRLLLGADLRKDVAVIERAYNDARGVTAEFNRNVLEVLNRELHADFVASRFAHRAFYNTTLHRIEMHLDSIGDQRVPVPSVGTITFRDGESIRTEISCKYDRDTVARLFAAAGLVIEEWVEDEEHPYALVLGAPA
ncbi:MAG: L-histidine N(alpha)-methyltransferase [Gemmatimonadota bacterium]|nr:L-histidine N(alpha)-methyltransferase [Gemmatimonadota bacterium]